VYKHFYFVHLFVHFHITNVGVRDSHCVQAHLHCPLFVHFHLTNVGVQDSHCVQAHLHCSLFHTFSPHKCGSPGLPLCTGPFTSFAFCTFSPHKCGSPGLPPCTGPFTLFSFPYIFTPQMWESWTPTVYRPIYIVRFLYIFTSQMWESRTPTVYRLIYIVLFSIHFHLTNVGVQDSHCVQAHLHRSLFCTFSHHKCGSPGLPLCTGACTWFTFSYISHHKCGSPGLPLYTGPFTSFIFSYIFTSQMWESRTPAVYRACTWFHFSYIFTLLMWESRTPVVYRHFYFVHRFVHFHILDVGVLDSHHVQALVHCSLFHTFSHHKCGSPGLPLCTGACTWFTFSYIFTSQMWESRTPAVYRPFYIICFFVHFHITNVGVQDSRCVQALLHCSLFCTFSHHKCGSPGLPLCTGPFTLFIFSYIYMS
jgi:hypothetical protein